MKIIQLNIEFGYRLPAILDFLAEEKPDILCCQEVIDSPAAAEIISGGFDFIEKVTKSSSLGYHFLAPLWGGEVLGGRLEFGNVILSRFPLTNQQTIFINKQYDPDTTVKNNDYNIRNLQICVADIAGKKLAIANHHGYIVRYDPAKDHLGGPETINFIQKVADSLRPFTESLIFCGDLNIDKASPSLKPIAELGLRNLTTENDIKTTLSQAHRTPPEIKNSVACDYIFCSQNIQVKNFRVSDKILSDHKALILEFDI